MPCKVWQCRGRLVLCSDVANKERQRNPSVEIFHKKQTKASLLSQRWISSACHYLLDCTTDGPWLFSWSRLPTRCLSSPLHFGLCVTGEEDFCLFSKAFQALRMQTRQNIVISHIFQAFCSAGNKVCVEKPQGLSQIQTTVFTEYTQM